MEKNRYASDFIYKLNRGIAKPALFTVDLALPSGVKQTASSYLVENDSKEGNIKVYDDNAIGIMCYQTSFPQVTFSTYDVLKNSSRIAHPTALNYAPLTMSFYVDGSYEAYKFFRDWRNCVANVGSDTFNFYDEFVSTIMVTSLDDKFKDAVRVKYNNAYPIDIRGMEFESSRTNEIHSITVTFSYESFEEVFIK